jgi:hypothetical protein
MELFTKKILMKFKIFMLVMLANFVMLLGAMTPTGLVRNFNSSDEDVECDYECQMYRLHGPLLYT